MRASPLRPSRTTASPAMRRARDCHEAAQALRSEAGREKIRQGPEAE